MKKKRNKVKNIGKVSHIIIFKINWRNRRPCSHILFYCLYYVSLFVSWRIKTALTNNVVLCNIIFNVFSHPCTEEIYNTYNTFHYLSHKNNKPYLCLKKRVRPWDY